MPVDKDRIRTIPTEKIQQKIARMDQLFYITEDYNMKMSIRNTMKELKEEVERRNNAGIAVSKSRNQRLR